MFLIDQSNGWSSWLLLPVVFFSTVGSCCFWFQKIQQFTRASNSAEAIGRGTCAGDNGEGQSMIANTWGFTSGSRRFLAAFFRYWSQSSCTTKRNLSTGDSSDLSVNLLLLVLNLWPEEPQQIRQSWYILS